MRALAMIAAGMFLLAGCLPTSRPAEPRYFTPLLAEQAPAADAKAASGLPLRLRRVRAAAHLNERMVWRRADGESGFRELRRWTQPPERFVEQAVARQLFETRGFQRSEGGAVPSLDVEVRAFDEIVGSEPAALVEIGVLLTDRRRFSLLERTISVRRPLGDPSPVALARAMGQALDEAVERLADGVEAALAAR